MEVKLIAFTKPLIGDDPRRTILLAIKVSQGKLHEKSVEHYLTKYSEKDLERYLIEAVRYPSVYEHAVFTFLIDGISRVASHQLVRHRLASYTQESQRYSESYMKRVVDSLAKLVEEKRIPIDAKALELYRDGRYAEFIKSLLSYVESLGGCRALDKETATSIVEAVSEGFVVPPTLGEEDRVCVCIEYLRSVATYYELLSRGVPLEDARFVVPQAIKTRILMTVNLRELIHIACLRLSKKAQWEIRQLVAAMIREVAKLIPQIVEILELACGTSCLEIPGIEDLCPRK